MAYNEREIIIKFLTNIPFKELDKCNLIDNIPEVVDNYLNNQDISNG